ncbi:hypothetical protein GCM10010124_28080 [Pilimelia terevasa]|uniref:HTH tetR-type domain-containing protein n=1 Tax=Pilimelia terevasa TaxID=53372 RepID=A0A8J3FLE4_9ACTN|nr:TetR/AcrR family transcriptional regulator [Pilimelia terevasa]GGK33915.1 hypothetical protein GCM10010124_28080 [Pilimelia terevasa]
MKRTAEEAARTRATLCSVALRVFAAKGYVATTMAEVSETAGLTRGAIYHHFPRKSDLYVACVSAHWQRIAADMWVALDSPAPPAARLRELVGAFCRSLRQEETRLLLTLTIGARDLPADAGLSRKHDALHGLATRLEKLCDEAARTGDLRDGLTPRLAAEIAVVSLTGMVGILPWEPWPLTFPENDAEVGDAVVRAIMKGP